MRVVRQLAVRVEVLCTLPASSFAHLPGILVSTRRCLLHIHSPPEQQTHPNLRLLYFPFPLALPLALCAAAPPLALPLAVLVDLAAGVLLSLSSCSLLSSSASSPASCSPSSSATDPACLAERLDVLAGALTTTAALPLPLAVPGFDFPMRIEEVGASLGSTLKDGVKRTGMSGAKFSSGKLGGMLPPSAFVNLCRHFSSA